MDAQDQLWREYRRTRDVRLRNALVEHYMPIVRCSAGWIHGKLPAEMELDDLVSAGVFGLLDAIGAYDPGRGVKFKTYAAPRIRGAIVDELRKMDWVPRLARNWQKKVGRVRADLEQRLGRPAGEAEMMVGMMEKSEVRSQRAGVRGQGSEVRGQGSEVRGQGSEVRGQRAEVRGQRSEGRSQKSEERKEQIARSRKAMAAAGKADREGHAMSLSRKRFETDSSRDILEIDMVEDRRAAGVDQELRVREMKALLTAGFSRTEKLIFLLYYFDRLTMKEAGRAVGMCESRVSQICANLGKRLRGRGAEIRGQMSGVR